MATGTMRKTVKIGERRAPAEIRDITKARRAWNAATIAEVTQEPGITAKVIGTGGYETVAVYRTTETVGRIQQRGTCQVCCRAQAIESPGVMVLHGYNRPGWGHIKGRCPGVGTVPAEVSTAIAEAAIVRLQDRITAIRQVEADYTAMAASWPYADDAEWAVRRALPKLETTDSRGRTNRATACSDVKGGWSTEAVHAGREARGLCDYFEALVTHVLPRLGQPLYEVVMPA